MGFLSSIGNIVSSVVGGASSYAPLISAGTSLLGGMMANSANERQAENQMDFQQYNSDTAYRRAMVDMKAAGLNPMLAMKQGGASTPTGSSAHISDPVTPAISTGMSMATNQANLENLQAQNAQIKSQTMLNKANSAAAIAATANTDVSTRLKASAIPGAETSAKAVKDNQWYFKHVNPYLPDLLSGANSAKSLGSLFGK